MQALAKITEDAKAAEDLRTKLEEVVKENADAVNEAKAVAVKEAEDSAAEKMTVPSLTRQPKRREANV